MKKAALFLWLLGVVAFSLAASEPPTGVGGVKDVASIGTGWIGVGSGSALPDTQIWVFETMWAGTSSLDAYPSSPDRVVRDTDGSKFKYGTGRGGGNKDVYTYYSTSNRMESIQRTVLMPSASQRQMFYWFPVTEIPATAQILSAKLYLNWYLGETLLTDVGMVYASVDTSEYNFTRLLAGPSQLVANSDPSRHMDTWNSADSTGFYISENTLWTYPHDSKTDLTDYGWTSVALEPGATYDAEEWWSLDLKTAVSKMVADGLDDRLIWLTFDYGEVAGKDFYVDNGPLAAAAVQPLLIVEWSDIQDYEPVDFLVFSDNHSNATGVQRMFDTIDPNVGSFALHNGDLNLSSSMDTTTLVDAIDTYFPTDYPLVLGWGNHETDADGAATGDMTDFFLGQNRQMIKDMPDYGADFTMFGLDTSYRNEHFISYSFDVGAAHIVVWNCLNTTTGASAMTTEDAEWLTNDLGQTQQPLKLVFCHYPIWDTPDIDNGTVRNYSSMNDAYTVWNFFDDLGVHAYISGHKHIASIDKFGSMWMLQGPSTADGTYQGFFDFTVDGSGSLVVDLYRGLQATTPWVKTQTQFIPVSRTDKVMANGVAATSGTMANGATGTEIFGKDFGASQGAGKVYMSDNAVFGAGTEVEQTVTTWQDDLIVITVDSFSYSVGSVWLFVVTDAGKNYSVECAKE